MNLLWMLFTVAIYTIGDRLKLWRNFRISHLATIVIAVTAAKSVLVILMVVTLCRIAFPTTRYLQAASFISTSLAAAKVIAELIVECTAPLGGASIWHGVVVVSSMYILIIFFVRLLAHFATAFLLKHKCMLPL